MWNILWSSVGGEDPTYIGSGPSTEGDQTSQRSPRVHQGLQMNSPSMAPTLSPTAARGGERLTCQCGSREPTSYANVARWQAGKSCSAALRRTPSKLPPPPTTLPQSPQRPARLTCPSLPCLWGCPSLSLRCPCPSPSPSLRRLNLLSAWMRTKQGELTTGQQVEAGTGWLASSDPVRGQTKGLDTDVTVTAKLALKPRVWTVPSCHMRCLKSDGRSARTGRSWMRGRRRKKERRERKQRETEGQSKMIVEHASSTHMQKLEKIVEGKTVLVYPFMKRYLRFALSWTLFFST